MGAHILVTLNLCSLDKEYREWEKENPSQLPVPGEFKDEGSSPSGEARGRAFRPPRWKSLRGKSHILRSVPPSIHPLSLTSHFPALTTVPSRQKPLLAPSLPASFLTAREGPGLPPLCFCSFMAHIISGDRDCTHREDRGRPLVLFLSCYPLCGLGFCF